MVPSRTKSRGFNSASPRSAGLIFSLACSLLLGCGGQASTSRTQPRLERGAVVKFAFGTPSGDVVNSSGLRGRATAVLFVTTYDRTSQLMARRLQEAVRAHRPRANALAVVLEAPKYAMLADVFAESLHLTYPIAMADAATRDGGGAFGDVRAVPALVVLTRKGRVSSKHLGAMSTPEIRAALTEAAR